MEEWSIEMWLWRSAVCPNCTCSFLWVRCLDLVHEVIGVPLGNFLGEYVLRVWKVLYSRDTGTNMINDPQSHWPQAFQNELDEGFWSNLYQLWSKRCWKGLFLEIPQNTIRWKFIFTVLNTFVKVAAKTSWYFTLLRDVYFFSDERKCCS